MKDFEGSDKISLRIKVGFPQKNLVNQKQFTVPNAMHWLGSNGALLFSLKSKGYHVALLTNFIKPVSTKAC